MESSSSASQTIPVGSSSGEWQQLLQDILGKEEGAAVAASLARREVVITVSSPEDQLSTMKTDLGTPIKGHGDGETCTPSSAHDNSALPVAIMEEPESVLHVVAAAGDSKRHLECARMIYGKARHLLTMAAPNSKGDTPLHCATRAGNTKMVACLIELVKGQGHVDHGKARDFVRMQNKRGETALHEAVRFDNLKMVQTLMSANEDLAQVNAKDETSPLYLASSLGHAKIVRVILDEGKEPSYSGPGGQNALHAAVLHGDKDITESLLKWKRDLVKQMDMDGSTPLHFAASAPDPSLQFTLFVFSASNFERLSMGFYFLPSRCLTKMFEGWKLPLTQLLEADPTSVFQPDNHGWFPVHVAASTDCTVSLIVLLTRYPGCAGLRNADGQTFLHVAVQKKRLNVVRFVCFMWGRRSFSKSVVNVQDKNGDTALHLAAREGEVDMCRLLIGNRHAHISLENHQGKTPMDLAAGAVKSGFYFGLSAPRRILNMLTFADAQTGNRRRDLVPEYNPRLEEEKESAKIKDFAQIVGIGSVLVATATFTAALTMPGGVWTPGDSAGKKLVHAPPAAGTPVLAGSLAFDGFVISNTLAFICSTLATFSLVYCGVAAVDIQKRFELVTFCLVLLLCSARSFCAALAFSLYLLLAKVAHGTAIASCVMTSLALLDGFWFLLVSNNDTGALMSRKATATFLKLGTGFLINLIYLFWPYLVIGGYLLYDFLEKTGKLRGSHH